MKYNITKSITNDKRVKSKMIKWSKFTVSPLNEAAPTKKVVIYKN